MKLIRLLGFLAQFTILGLAAAFLVVYFRPDLLLRDAPPPAPSISSFAPAVAAASRSVVNVHAMSESDEPADPAILSDPALREFYERRQVLPRPLKSSLGSGVIVGDGDYVLTNHHLIRHATDIRLALWDGSEAAARLVGTDPETDLAVLRMEADLPVEPLVFATRRPEVGDVVLAIGNPFGVGQTVTMGIVSATGRQDLAINNFESFIQTDAAINPGNSGGALINAEGELVGINSAVFAEAGAQGISFAIPVELAAQVLNEIIAHGRVVRGWLGVDTTDLRLADGTSGVLVSAVQFGSPAAGAGLLPGDLILQVDGEDVLDTRWLLEQVATRAPGTPVRIAYLRRDATDTVTAVLAERPPVTD